MVHDAHTKPRFTISVCAHAQNVMQLLAVLDKHKLKANRHPEGLAARGTAGHDMPHKTTAEALPGSSNSGVGNMQCEDASTQPMPPLEPPPPQQQQ